MSKMSKKERLAKARAAAKRLTASKAMDAYTIIGPIAHDLSQTALEDMPAKAGESLTGYNLKTGNINLGRVGRTYAGAGMNKLERVIYNIVGVNRPATRSNGNYGVGDALDWLTYYGAAGFHAWEARGDLPSANIRFYRTMFGIDVRNDGWDALQPQEWLWEKNIPYILQRKARQLPFVKQAFQKLSKAVGGF